MPNIYRGVNTFEDGRWRLQKWHSGSAVKQHTKFGWALQHVTDSSVIAPVPPMRVFVVSLTPAQRCSYADGQYGEGGVHREGECVEEPGRSCERADTPGMTENAERRCTLCACKCHLVQHRATTNESRVRRQAEESPCPMPPQQPPAFAQPPVARAPCCNRASAPAGPPAKVV